MGVLRGAMDTLTKDIYACVRDRRKLMNGSVYALLDEGEVRMKIHSTSYGILKSQSEWKRGRRALRAFYSRLKRRGASRRAGFNRVRILRCADRGDTATMAASQRRYCASLRPGLTSSCTLLY